MKTRLTYIALSGLALAALLAPSASAQGFQVFSSGFTTPETISTVPSGFGNVTPGSFLVPNVVSAAGAGSSVIEVVPPTGGSPVPFTNTLGFAATGGLFLPSGYGSFGGQYLVTGFNASDSTARYSILNSSGTATLSAQPSTFSLTTPALAPSGFGVFGGDVIITAQNSGGQTLWALLPNGSITPFVSGMPINAFGIAFAPQGFGNVGGAALVSDESSGAILSVSPNGQFTTFTSISLVSGQRGLRQMAFAPASFGNLGGLLFVSVSGSQLGGGTLGSLLALDSSGHIVSSLKIGSSVSAFDPRGLDFTDDGRLLVSDSSSPGKILVFTPSAFVPEPASLVSLAIGGLTLLWWGRRRRLARVAGTIGVGSIYLAETRTGTDFSRIRHGHGRIRQPALREDSHAGSGDAGQGAGGGLPERGLVGEETDRAQPRADPLE
jgi:hypothetical protein